MTGFENHNIFGLATVYLCVLAPAPAFESESVCVFACFQANSVRVLRAVTGSWPRALAELEYDLMAFFLLTVAELLLEMIEVHIE